MNAYDSTADTRKHQLLVKSVIWTLVGSLIGRSEAHDDSKLEEPEKPVFDIWRPKLDVLECGSDEYKRALANMGTSLQHHYEHNRHHPEHFEAGVAGMTLVDLTEMVCDWIAAAGRTGAPVSLDYMADRFNLDTQLVEIIANTVRAFNDGTL